MGDRYAREIPPRHLGAGRDRLRFLLGRRRLDPGRGARWLGRDADRTRRDLVLRLPGGPYPRRIPVPERRRTHLPVRRRRDLRLRRMHGAHHDGYTRLEGVRPHPLDRRSRKPGRRSAATRSRRQGRTTSGSRTTGSTWPTTREGSGSWTSRENFGVTSTGRGGRSPGFPRATRAETAQTNRTRGAPSPISGTSSSPT